MSSSRSLTYHLAQGAGFAAILILVCVCEKESSNFLEYFTSTVVESATPVVVNADGTVDENAQAAEVGANDYGETRNLSTQEANDGERSRTIWWQEAQGDLRESSQGNPTPEDNATDSPASLCSSHHPLTWFVRPMSALPRQTVNHEPCLSNPGMCVKQVFTAKGKKADETIGGGKNAQCHPGETSFDELAKLDKSEFAVPKEIAKEIASANAIPSVMQIQVASFRSGARFEKHSHRDMYEFFYFLPDDDDDDDEDEKNDDQRDSVHSSSGGASSRGSSIDDSSISTHANPKASGENAFYLQKEGGDVNSGENTVNHNGVQNTGGPTLIPPTPGTMVMATPGYSHWADFPRKKSRFLVIAIVPKEPFANKVEGAACAGKQILDSKVLKPGEPERVKVKGGDGNQPTVWKRQLIKYCEIADELLTLAEQFMEPGSTVRKHTHEDAFEFYFVISGGGTIRRWNTKNVDYHSAKRGGDSGDVGRSGAGAGKADENSEDSEGAFDSFEIGANSAVRIPPGVAHEWQAGKNGMKGIYFMMKEA